ncbi:hypothetical protein Bbelb_123340 [Branchiostoma belcheri]|nr:hypothetical protein Bbelb_123340 [Branchiostoma belcheri]
MDRELSPTASTVLRHEETLDLMMGSATSIRLLHDIRAIVGEEALAQQRTRMAIPLAHFEGSAWRLASHADSLATIGTLWVTKGMFPVESLPAAETDDVLGVTRHALRLLIPNDVTSFPPNRHSVVWSNLANDGSAVETQPAGTEDNSCPQAIGIVKGKTKTR